MGRDSTADKTPLLMNAEQNIGNSAVIYPQAGGVGSGTVIPQTNPSRILQLTGGSAVGQTTSIVMTASRTVGSLNPNPGLPGPITGIIEFGNGGRATKVEFDVPIGPYQGAISLPDPANEPQDGGIIISVPTGVLRAYARYDNLLLATVLGTNQSLAQIRKVTAIGPGGPHSTLNLPTPAEPVQVKAMAAYFSRHFARAYKTLYCYLSDPIGPSAIVIGDPAGGGYDFFCLPAFARSVKVLRLNTIAPPPPTMPALKIVLHNGVNIVDMIDIAAGVNSPDIKVEGHECIIGIRSATAGDTVTLLALSCEVGV